MLQENGALSGKAAVVTGGASGIGKAVVARLHNAGAYVCIADINLDLARAVAMELDPSQKRVVAVRCDIGEDDQIRSAVETAVERFGRLDVMHNNAALLDTDVLENDKDIRTIPIDTWDRVMAVTLRGTMLGCRHAVNAMLKSGGGSIINTSTMLSLAADNIVPAYSVSKAGINMLTQWVAAKYGRQGIRCNAVAPSVIRTPLIERAMPAEYVKLHQDAALTPDLGTPDDVAAIVEFLAGDNSRYITGQIIRADGGTTTTVPVYAAARKFFD